MAVVLAVRNKFTPLMGQNEKDNKNSSGHNDNINVSEFSKVWTFSAVFTHLSNREGRCKDILIDTVAGFTVSF